MYPNMSVRTCTYIYQQLSAYINDYECMANGNAWKFKDMWIKNNSSCQNFSMLNTTHPARPHGPMGWLQILDVSLHGSKQCLMAQFKWGFRPSNFISHKIFYIFMAILEFALHLWLQLIGCPPPFPLAPAQREALRCAKEPHRIQTIVVKPTARQTTAKMLATSWDLQHMQRPTCARIFMQARMTLVMSFFQIMVIWSMHLCIYLHALHQWERKLIFHQWDMIFPGGNVYWIILMSWNLSPKLSCKCNLLSKNDLVWHWVLRIKSSSYPSLFIHQPLNPETVMGTSGKPPFAFSAGN